MTPNTLVVLGYSGGGDSTFLLRQLRAEGRPVLAAIVDHGLRDGSAADAARAAAIAREAGADAEVLTISWPEGPRAAQAKARDVRLAALATFAARHGVDEIHLAHTLDDQAETVLIRLAAQSGWRGLAGMAERAPMALWPEGRGLQVVRPLLGRRRAEIRSALREGGADWIEDPANALGRYTRVRARGLLVEWDAAPRWAALATRFAVLAAAVDHDARACLADAARVEGEAAEVSVARLSAFAPSAQLRALGALICAVAGAAREPGDAAVSRLLETGGTLGGAWVQRRGETLFLRRDRGAILGRSGLKPLAPLTLTPGISVVWDGRLAVEAAEAGWSIVPEAQDAAPILTKDCSQLTLMEAAERGLAHAKWLLGERIAHLLWR